MGVFDSDFRDAFREKSAASPGMQTNAYESGGLQPEFGGLQPKSDAHKSELTAPQLEFGVNQNDLKNSGAMENINDGQGASLIAQTNYSRTASAEQTTDKPEAVAARQETESVTEMASRLLLSTGAGYLTHMGLSLAGLRNIPKIGTPLALASGFLAAGAASSYQKTETLTDMRSFAEGALVYGGVCGFRYVGRAIEAPAYNVGVMPQQTIRTPFKIR